MNWKDRNVLITGGAGFIGSHLSDALVELGANVIVADITKNELKNIEHLEDKITIIDCDVTKNSEIEKIGKNIEYIFHLAAYAVPNLCEKNPDIAFNTNIHGTFNVLKFALNSSIEKLIFPSSAFLYGKYPKYLPIDEEHPIDTTGSVYSVTKKIGEDLTNLFYEKHGLPAIVLRLFTTFGERQSTDYFFPTIITQAIKNNVVELWNDKPTRDFTYVANTIDALIKAAEVKYCGGPINIGSGVEMNVGEVARKIADILNVEVKFLNKEVVGSMRLCCDNTKAKNILKWKPRISFEDGLRKTIKWYKQNYLSY